MKKLPLGIFTFDKVMNGNFLYVDKSKYIYELARYDQPLLLSRPHNFGKTLLLSAVKSFFLGKKEQFKGLWVEKQDYDWKPHQIIHLDMSRVNTASLIDMKHSLSTNVAKIVKAANFKMRGRSASEILHNFIDDLRRMYNERVVLLIDEYETPIINNIFLPQKLPFVFGELSKFYSVIEKAKESLRFTLLTGVERFPPRALFSGAPSLRDVTFDPKFTSICGLTIGELDQHFQEYMEATLSFLKEENLLDEESGLAELRSDIIDWYGGYSWDGKTRLISPFFLLHFFRAKEFNNFWHTAKTPTKLIKLVHRHKLAFGLFDKSLSITPETSVIDHANLLPIPVLFQTGYLTVKSVTRQEDRLKYNLVIPNFASRWLLFVYLMARQFHCKPGQLWSEMDQILRALKNRDAKITALAFKRLLASFDQQTIKPFSTHYRQVFLYAMSILGQPLWADGPTGQGLVNGLFKGPGNVFYVIQMSFLKLPESSAASAKTDSQAGEEWEFGQNQFEMAENELEDEARASLLRLDEFNYVETLHNQGQEVVKAAIVVQSDSAVKVLFEEVD
ncbi:MAG: AAA family ATPase [Deltaproteobacteria bacterium]|jgi:hypothetical protein|nr:AAA family ATPase [Deltaproteobacteria bacterium]